ncbi:MAG: Zn-dependent alcohol dehydrogenase [Gammaproteobacteria bacterium]|nr:Zn-dependent alcohol dehydrogenase [Gammaproteobacteria bacterium]
MKSRAAVLFEAGQKLEVREVDVQDPGPGEVRIRMAAGGVCHSDLHVMTGHLKAPLPAILGHEGAGIVADVGAGVTAVQPGDHVIPLWRLSCGECEYCSGGRPALCAAGTEIRWSGRLLDGTTRFKLDGEEIKHFAGVSSFSNYTVLPEQAVLKIPDDIPLERAALLGCAVITGVGAVIHGADVKPGRTVAVFGTGGVGVNVVQGAALAGAEKIIAVDLLASRLEQAQRFGATHAVNAADGDPVEQIRDLTGGRGVDYSFEVIGLPLTMRQAYDCLAKRGVAMMVGITPTTAEVTIPSLSLVYEERVVTGSLYGSAAPKIDIPRLIDLYRAGKLMLDELLTRTYPIEEINQAYSDLESGATLRSVVTF